MNTTPLRLRPLTMPRLDGLDGPDGLGGLGGQPAEPDTDREAPFAPVLGDPGLCSGRPARHVVINDRSPSLGGVGQGGTDPIGLRYAALLRALERLAANCRCRKEEVELISFDLRSSFDLPPTLIHRRSLAPIRRALTEPDCGFGCSTLGPALHEATTSLQEFSGYATLTVLSDWLLTDRASVIPALVSLPVDRLHVVALSAPAPAGLDVGSVRLVVSEATWSDDPAELAQGLFSVFTSGRRQRSTRRGWRR